MICGAMERSWECDPRMPGIMEGRCNVDNDDYNPDWDLNKVKPVTRSLIEAIVFDVWPTPAAANDFGIASQQHYEAIYYPLRNDEISFAQLDAAYGNGPKLTELVNAMPSNPHKGIVFETPWDLILGHIPAGKDGKKTLEDLKTRGDEKQPGRSRPRGKVR